MSDELNKGKEAVGERLAKLLAGSLVAQEVKDAILENLDKMPESAIAGLLDSLEKENQVTGRLATDLEVLGKVKDKEWADLEQKQQQEADHIVEQFLKEQEKKLSVEDIKSSLP